MGTEKSAVAGKWSCMTRLLNTVRSNWERVGGEGEGGREREGGREGREGEGGGERGREKDGEGKNGVQNNS